MRMMNRWADKPRVVNLTIDATEITPNIRTVLDLSADTVSRMLATFRSDEARLTADIADATERLRQTRVAIAAFDAAGKIIVEGTVP